jgi:hypothetical protein
VALAADPLAGPQLKLIERIIQAVTDSNHSTGLPEFVVALLLR